MDVKLYEDTICAIATPMGEGGIGIIKISGPEAFTVASKLFRPQKPSRFLKPYQLCHGWIVDPDSQDIIDEVLVSSMTAPGSYTREDVVEINCHGGFLVLNQIMQLILRHGPRLAEPGEFTRRAFLAGRIDLSQAEAVLDMIHSRSQRHLQAAAAHLKGEFRDRILTLRGHLLQLQTAIEASIDFTDDVEEDLVTSDSLLIRLEEQLLSPLSDMLDHYREGRILREGLKIALVGRPNVGKSSLLNALVQKDRAIVTPFPGTTRDIVEDSFLLGGVLVTILDTAGIRAEPDMIESIGIKRTFLAVAEADIVLWLIDQSRHLDTDDEEIFQSIATTQFVIILNKSDLPIAVNADEITERYCRDRSVVSISALNQEDVERLRSYLLESFLRQPMEMSRSALVPNLRHKNCLEHSLQALIRGKQLIESKSFPELISLEIHSARRHLDRLLGLEVEEDLLDSIFSQFCIGK